MEKSITSIDYFKLFAFIARLEIVLSLLLDKAIGKFSNEFKINFLEWRSRKEAYIKHLEGYVIKGEEYKVYKLKQKNKKKQSLI